MGGLGAEHEISMLSGQAMLQHLNRKRYLVRTIAISKENKWFSDGRLTKSHDALRGLDVALLALHGEFGEDGRMQAFLEHYRIPYTGSGVIASALGMDKLVSRSIFRNHGIFTPRTAALGQREFAKKGGVLSRKIQADCGSLPWVVKPRGRGSSVGVSIVKDARGLPKAIRYALGFDDQILVEEYLRGTEITVPVLERKPGKPEVLPIVEIRPKKSAFFDYREKYAGAGGAEEIIPARIGKRDLQKSVESALAAYRLLGCKGYARIDAILLGGRPYILEVNTLPGMTPVSLFPKSAQASGIAYSQLLDILIANALRSLS